MAEQSSPGQARDRDPDGGSIVEHLVRERGARVEPIAEAWQAHLETGDAGQAESSEPAGLSEREARVRWAAGRLRMEAGTCEACGAATLTRDLETTTHCSGCR